MVDYFLKIDSVPGGSLDSHHQDEIDVVACPGARQNAATPEDYFKVTLSDITVTSYHVGGSDGDVPVDDVSLRFAKIQVDYRPQKATGALGAAVHAGWDVKQNKEI